MKLAGGELRELRWGVGELGEGLGGYEGGRRVVLRGEDKGGRRGALAQVRRVKGQCHRALEGHFL